MFPDLFEIIGRLRPGKALDLACGKGRHSAYLAERGWDVTAVDIAEVEIPGVRFVQVDLEQGEFAIEAGKYDLIVVWLYWQSSLLPSIELGVKPGGVVALAGKTEGRFATSLHNYRQAFDNDKWVEVNAGEESGRAWFVAYARFPAIKG